MKNELRIKRLEMLKDMLENHKKIFPTVAFNMESWLDVQSVTDLVLSFFGKSKKEKNLCGTAACALGSAAIYAPFNAMGLKLAEDESGFFATGTLTPSYMGEDGVDAGSKFFGITEEEATDLFIPEEYEKNCHYITPRDVAKRVQKVISTYSKK